MLNINKKDRKILYELDTNSRQSYKSIGKKVGLSDDAVIYRINKLKELGLIKAFHTLIDVGKLGYFSFRLYFKLTDATPQKHDELITYLEKSRLIIWLGSADGDYDIAAWVLVKNMEEMTTFWHDLRKKYNDYFDEKIVALWTQLVYYPRVFLVEKQFNDKEYICISEPQQVDIDKKDLAILRLMSGNARINILEIAKTLQISHKTAVHRLKELERKKIITGYRTVFNLEKIGILWYKIFIKTHNVTDERERNFRNYIKQHPQTIYYHQVLGGSDFEIELQVNSVLELRNFMDQLREKFADFIKTYKIVNYYKEHKYVFFPE